jgi:hypothetical protein
MDGGYSVYRVLDDPSKPMAMTLVAEKLTRAQANTMAATMRRNRETSKTKVAVYSGITPQELLLREDI